MSMLEGDFDAWFQSLSPEDQEFVIYQLGLDQANSSPYSFGDMAPELSGPEFDLTTFNGGMPTDYNSKGEPLPWGLDQEAQAATLQKNLNALLADNITGALAGPGAYGPNAFVPREVYSGDILETPGANQAAYYSQQQGGFEALIADAIMNGDSPSQAVAKVLQLAQLPDSETLTPELRAQRDAVLMSLPPGRIQTGPQVPSQDLTDAQKFAQQYDVDALYNFADQLGGAIASDPQGGFRDPETGITYARPPQQEYSAAAQKFLDLGLPFPTDNYTDEAYLDLMAPLDREGNALAMADAQARADEAGRGLPSYAQLDEMERLLTQYTDRQNLAKMPIVGQGVQGDRTSLNVGPVARSDGEATGARVTSPADQFRVAPEKPTFYMSESGEFNFGNQAPQGPFNPINYVNQIIARGGGQGPKGGSISETLIAKGRKGQENARQARSQALDVHMANAYAERDRAAAAGQAQALANAGRTPLTDAMLKRLMAQRAQGFYG